MLFRSTVFAAAYLLWLYQRTAFGTPPGAAAHGDAHGHDAHGHDAHGHAAHAPAAPALPDVNRYEWVAWTPLLVAILVFGVVPNLLFSVIDPAVTAVLGAFGG